MVASGFSFKIGAKAAQTNYYAEMQARRLGFPLTHMVTINYASTVIDPRMAVASFSKLRRDRFNKWATRPRLGAGPPVPPTYAFAFENVRDGIAIMTMNPGDPHNVHVHWAVHIPAARLHDFEGCIWSWVEETTGGIIGGGETIDVRPIEVGLRGYLVKGATDQIAALYGRGRKAKPQGIIYGRRADTSRNLGPTARRLADQVRGIRRQMPSVVPRTNYADQ